jgi:hypothetical protein
MDETVYRPQPFVVETLNMEPFTIVVLGNIAVAVLVVAVSLPLLWDKIPMNHWYGVRIAKSFVSTDNWYRINRYGGRWLIIYGVCLALLSLVALMLPPPKTVNFWFWTVSLAPLLLLPIPLGAIFKFAKTLPDGE